MLESLKNNVRLLRRSKRHIILFELTYKLLAVAVIYPILTAAINLCMKVAGIRYLTNEYIVKALTNPVVIIALFTGIILFVGYCIYEMAYLAVCFETKRKGNNASIIDNIYNAYLRLKNLIRIQSIPLFLFFFISIIFINVTIVANLIYSDTLSNLIGSTMRRNRYMIYMLVAIVMVLIYYYVIRGIFSFNIYMMEGKNFRQSYKKSSQIVRNNRLRVIMSVIVYNLAIFAAIAVFYTVISLILIGGVKLLDMAYLGSAVYLSVLRELRAGVKIFLVFISIPCSFSMISYMYYKYSDLDDIEFEFVDIDEGSARVNRIIYAVVLALSIVLDVIYIIGSFNNNPFERVAIFHNTDITAHRGASEDAPENTLGAFRKAIEDMSDVIELDVQMTKDGVVMVTHDTSLRRCTGRNANIYDLTFDEVRKLDAGRWFSAKYAGTKIPTLEEVLDLCKGRIQLNIEIKPSTFTPTLEAETVRLIHAYDYGADCVVTSQSYETLCKVKELDPDITTGYILALGVGTYYDLPAADFFSVESTFITAGMVQQIHLRGKTISAWTVNRQQDAEKLLQLGVDDLITDKPEIIAPLLARDKALDNRLLWLRDQIQELLAAPDAEEAMEVEETIEDAIEDPEEVLDEA